MLTIKMMMVYVYVLQEGHDDFNALRVTWSDDEM